MTMLFANTYGRQCSWNYRFDSHDNHFNVVYPDKNAVYFGMILPPGTETLQIASKIAHPISAYFSLQVYEIGGDSKHYNDQQLLPDFSPMSQYDLTVELAHNISYFVLFRIYVPHLDYWGGVPPQTFVNSIEYPLCDIDYEQQGNIYTNLTYGLNNDTGTVCAKNEVFLFMDAPAGSLVNADANYMIACVKPCSVYRVSIRIPAIMCSHEDDDYDLRYASLSLVSTSAPRPTIWTIRLPCNASVFETDVATDDIVVMPALLYRQLLPSSDFEYSIDKAKTICYDNQHADKCIHAVMESYYPKIERVQPMSKTVPNELRVFVV